MILGAECRQEPPAGGITCARPKSPPTRLHASRPDDAPEDVVVHLIDTFTDHRYVFRNLSQNIIRSADAALLFDGSLMMRRITRLK